jgi:hypothetical protein
MRTTIEMPDELLVRAKREAAFAGITLREFFIQAVEQKLEPVRKKVRRPPPRVGAESAPPITVLTPEQIDEAMFA